MAGSPKNNSANGMAANELEMIRQAMMEELGNARLDSLPLDDSHRTRGGRDNNKIAATNRFPNDLQQQGIPTAPADSMWKDWQNAVRSGAFNDSDREAVASLDTLGGARSYTNSTNSYVRQGRDMTMRLLASAEPLGQNGFHGSHSSPTRPRVFDAPVRRELPPIQRGPPVHHRPILGLQKASALGIVPQGGDVPTRYFPPKYACGSPVAPDQSNRAPQAVLGARDANLMNIKPQQLQPQQQPAASNIIFHGPAKLRGDTPGLKSVNIVLRAVPLPVKGHFYLYVLDKLFVDWSMDRYMNYRNRVNDIMIFFRKQDGSPVSYHLIFETGEGMLEFIHKLQDLMNGKYELDASGSVVPAKPPASKSSAVRSTQPPSVQAADATETRAVKAPSGQAEPKKTRPADPLPASQSLGKQDTSPGPQKGSVRVLRITNTNTHANGQAAANKSMQASGAAAPSAAHVANLMDADDEELVKAGSTWANNSNSASATLEPALIDFDSGDVSGDVVMADVRSSLVSSAVEDLKNLDPFDFTTAAETTKVLEPENGVVKHGEAETEELRRRESRQQVMNFARQLLRLFHEHLEPCATMQQITNFAQGIRQGIVETWLTEQPDYKLFNSQDQGKLINTLIQEVFGQPVELTKQPAELAKKPVELAKMPPIEDVQTPEPLIVINMDATTSADAAIPSLLDVPSSRIVYSKEQLLALRSSAVNPPSPLPDFRSPPEPDTPRKPTIRAGLPAWQAARRQESTQGTVLPKGGEKTIKNGAGSSTSASTLSRDAGISGLKKSKWADDEVDIEAEAKFTGPAYEFPASSNVWALAKLDLNVAANEKGNQEVNTKQEVKEGIKQEAKQKVNREVKHEVKREVDHEVEQDDQESDAKIRNLIERVGKMMISEESQSAKKTDMSGGQRAQEILRPIQEERPAAAVCIVKPAGPSAVAEAAQTPTTVELAQVSEVRPVQPRVMRTRLPPSRGLGASRHA